MAEEPISPVTSSKPELTISEAAINSEPVELDGTPTSPERASGKRRSSKQDDLSPEEQEQRAKLISERQGDKGVLVDIPQTPSASEFARSEDAEAKPTDVSSS